MSKTLCIGGPLDGQMTDLNRYYIEAIEPSKPNYTFRDIHLNNAITLFKNNYCHYDWVDLLYIDFETMGGE